MWRNSGLATSRGFCKGPDCLLPGNKAHCGASWQRQRVSRMGPNTGPQNSFNMCSWASPTSHSTQWINCNQTSHCKFGPINAYHKVSLLAWHFMCVTSWEGETRRKCWSSVSLGKKKGSKWISSCMQKPREGPWSFLDPRKPWVSGPGVAAPAQGWAKSKCHWLHDECVDELTNLHVLQYLVQSTAPSRDSWKKKEMNLFRSVLTCRTLSGTWEPFKCLLIQWMGHDEGVQEISSLWIAIQSYGTEMQCAIVAVNAGSGAQVLGLSPSSATYRLSDLGQLT